MKRGKMASSKGVELPEDKSMQNFQETRLKCLDVSEFQANLKIKSWK